MVTKTFLYSALALVGILILIPIGAYVGNFYNSGLSDDPQAWGVLGDYFGGILNPLISLASLCVLGYLTYLVAQQSSKDSKSIFILERRMLAYDEIARFIKPINSLAQKVKSITALKKLHDKLPPVQAMEYQIKTTEQLFQLSHVYGDLYFSLFEFQTRYGHLFKYDFSSDAYKNLLSESRTIANMMSEIMSGETQASPKGDLTISREFLELFTKFMNAIISEIDIDSVAHK